MSVRRSLHRALALAASVPVLSVAVLAAAPAAHASGSMPTCDHDLSTRLFTGDVLGEPERIWVQAVTPTETHVCYGNYLAEMTVVLTSGVGLGVPQVIKTPGTGTCAGGTEILDTQDPVAFEMSVGYSTAPLLCWGIGDETTTVTFTGASITTLPDVAVWRSGGNFIDAMVCEGEFQAWQNSGGGYGTSQYYAYHNCYDNPHAII